MLRGRGFANNRPEDKARDRGSRSLAAPAKACVVQGSAGESVGEVYRLPRPRRLRSGADRLALVPAQCFEGFCWNGRNGSNCEPLRATLLRLRLDQSF